MQLSSGQLGGGPACEREAECACRSFRKSRCHRTPVWRCVGAWTPPRAASDRLFQRPRPTRL